MSKARINPPVSPGLTLKCTTLTMAYAAAAAAAAWWPAKDCEIPQPGTTGKLEDSHSGVSARSESGLIPQAGQQRQSLLRSPWLML